MAVVENDIDDYLLEGEEVSYSFSHRPSGFLNWLKSLFGYGKSYWNVTSDRLIVYRRMAGGFTFQEVPLDKITSISYGQKLDLQLVALGVITTPILVGFLLLLYAFLRRPQVLEVHVSGGATLSVIITKGSDVNEFLWYLPTRRKMDGMKN